MSLKFVVKFDFGCVIAIRGLKRVVYYPRRQLVRGKDFESA